MTEYFIETVTKIDLYLSAIPVETCCLCDTLCHRLLGLNSLREWAVEVACIASPQCCVL